MSNFVKVIRDICLIILIILACGLVTNLNTFIVGGTLFTILTNGK